MPVAMARVIYARLMSQVFFGIVVVVLSLLSWGGQTIVFFAPATGAKWGLSEKEADVEMTFWADIRGEALWDFLTLWTLVVAGVLLIIDQAAWRHFGLVGGGMYVYFAGRGIFARVSMMRRGLRIGTPQGAKVALAFLTIWGVTGLATIAAAIASLSVS